MKAKCPHCGYEEDAPEEYVGETAICDSCGKEFVVCAVEVPSSAFDNLGNAVIECPHCNSENNIHRDYVGRNVRCCECEEKFQIRGCEDKQTELEVNSPMSKLSEEFKHAKSYNKATMVICPSCRRRMAVPDDTAGTAYRCDSCGNEFTIVGQGPLVRGLGCETVLMLCFLLFLVIVGISAAVSDPSNCAVSIILAVVAGISALLILGFHVHTGPSEQEVIRVRAEARQILKKRDEEEEKKKRDEEEKKRDEEEEKKCILSGIQATCKVAITELSKLTDPSDDIEALLVNEIAMIQKLGKPEVLAHDYFKFTEGEEMYFYARNVDCRVPHATREERFTDGTLAITNKRLVYACEDHKQTYRIENIRDFTPSWLFNLCEAPNCKGELDVSSSDKRREIYSLENTWLPSFILMYLWNDAFRERGMTVDMVAGAH